VPSATPYDLNFPKIRVHNPTPKLQSLLSEERLNVRSANLTDTFTGSIRKQAHEKFCRKGIVGVSRDCPNFLVPPIMSRTDKATNFKFCTHILTIDRNKSPLQISSKIAGCVVRTLKNFQGTHILGASCGLLCDLLVAPFISGTSKAEMEPFNPPSPKPPP